MRLAYAGNSQDQQRMHRQTCELMDYLGAAFNPINYLVCYEYFIGENKSLVDEIDELRSRNQKWSNILGVRLKEKHIDAIEKKIMETENELITIIGDHSEKRVFGFQCVKSVNENESH